MYKKQIGKNKRQIDSERKKVKPELLNRIKTLVKNPAQSGNKLEQNDERLFLSFWPLNFLVISNIQTKIDLLTQGQHKLSKIALCHFCPFTMTLQLQAKKQKTNEDFLRKNVTDERTDSGYLRRSLGIQILNLI